MIKQNITLPNIADCPCGSKARVVDLMMAGWLYGPFRVECQNNHHFTKPCATANRAIHRHNKRVLTANEPPPSTKEKEAQTVRRLP